MLPPLFFLAGKMDIADVSSERAPVPNAQKANELETGQSKSGRRRVKFHDNALTEEFNDDGLWAHGQFVQECVCLCVEY